MTWGGCGWPCRTWWPAKPTGSLMNDFIGGEVYGVLESVTALELNKQDGLKVGSGHTLAAAVTAEGFQILWVWAEWQTEGLRSRLLDGPTEPDSTGLSFFGKWKQGLERADKETGSYVFSHTTDHQEDKIRKRTHDKSSEWRSCSATIRFSCMCITSFHDLLGFGGGGGLLSFPMTVICSICCDSVPHMFSRSRKSAVMWQM